VISILFTQYYLLQTAKMRIIPWQYQPVLINSHTLGFNSSLVLHLFFPPLLNLYTYCLCYMLKRLTVFACVQDALYIKKLTILWIYTT
jgi:hypothetical protein